VNARRVNAASGVVHAAMQSRQTAAGIAAALEAACLLQSPETAAEQRETAAALRDTLGALLETQVERDVLAARVAELEAERHSTNEALSEAAEQLRANRDRLAQLEKGRAAVLAEAAVIAQDISRERDDTAGSGRAISGRLFSLADAAGAGAGRGAQPDETHTGCGMPLTRRLECGHCPHEVCEDCDRCPCSCRCGAAPLSQLAHEVLEERSTPQQVGDREDRFVSPLHTDYRTPHDLPPATDGPGVTA
jgi:hypothetical protein